MSRWAVLGWSALSGLVAGLVVGVLALGALVLLAQLPGVPERLAERLRLPVILLLLVVLPLAGAILGWLEGRAKL